MANSINVTYGDDEATSSSYMENASRSEVAEVTTVLGEVEGLGDYTREPLFYIRIIIVLFGLVGILTNGVCLAIILRYSTVRSKMGNFFIIHQCVVDLVGSLLLFITYIIILTVRSFHGRVGEFVCRLFISEGPVWYVFNVSTINLVVVTLERYVKIVKSTRYPVLFSDTRKYVIIAIVWILNAVYKLPPNITTTNAVEGKCFFQAFWPSKELQRAFGIATFFFFYFIPLIVFSLCYGHILHTVREKAKSVASHANSSSDTGNGSSEAGGQNIQLSGQMKLLKTVSLVCVGFVVCWTPTHVHYLCYNLGVKLSYSDGLYYFTLLMSVANCFVNPFIYLAKFKEFRKALAGIFSC